MTAPDGYRAIVRVESVWVGPAVPVEVEVRSDVQPIFGEGIEDLASFDQGQKYLFVPENSNEAFKFPGCGGPQRYTRVLDQYRPSSEHLPAAMAPWTVLWKQAAFWVSAHLPLVVAILLVGGGSVSLATRRLRHPDIGSRAG